MPRCPRCGAEVGPDNVYCSQCGNTLLKICYHCGSKIPLNANFCNNCGTRYEKFEPKFDYKIPVPVEEGNTLTDMRATIRSRSVTRCGLPRISASRCRIPTSTVPMRTCWTFMAACIRGKAPASALLRAGIWRPAGTSTNSDFIARA